ncbi:DUF6932 family protein [Desulfotignum phosphitoxidans]|uniref:Uncharacterized protein n=1 Tax=Desulfotignum phosphitoxidans DSM 13687 TaxID=1286635 RepID=S0G564_9BACT|nr:hypothetical protein [Desulfotignum phosphitoxidans]EMS79191.1 hypothetical protein Dpo_5c01140 [Desulfotignum phosphitoxidans DSM 13687]
MFDENGNLPPGFHDWSLSEIKENLVKNFSSDSNRGKLFSGYCRLRDEMISIDLQFEHWIDGSFCTQKIKPNDIDMLSIIPAENIEKLNSTEKNKLVSCVNGPISKEQYCCDSYMLAAVPENHPNYQLFHKMHMYWYGEFGLDRPALSRYY